MSNKQYQIEITGDKVEVVEWVGEEPKPAEYAERLGRRITYEQAYQTYLLDKADATRYSTLESDREYWLAKKGVFGEECFDWTDTGDTLLTAIPRKEDDVETWEQIRLVISSLRE